MLTIKNLHAYYGKSHVLHGVSFDVQPGEIVALLGRNGSGRSTTAKAIMGLVDCQGSISWKNAEIVGKEAYKIAHLGIGYVPENRDIFPKLTVHQNLLLGQKGSGKGSRWSFDDMYSMFPRLLERQHTEAGVLSGGEQQMLTLCRTLMGDPDLIIIDEPTEGLAPKIVQLVGQYLQTLKAKGISVLLTLLYALSYPDRLPTDWEPLDLVKAGNLTFREPDHVKYPCMGLAYAAGRAGGCLPAVLNAANEEAVALFLDEKIKFLDIPKLIEKTCDRFDSQNVKNPNLDDILEADAWGRRSVIELASSAVMC